MILIASAISSAQTPEKPKFRLVFSDTDTGEVLRVIGARTGANIVYGVQEKILITVNISVSTAEEAVRGTVAAAGLAYKRVGGTYIVAKPDSLRLAVQPYTSRVEFSVQFIEPADLAKLIEGAFFAVTAKGGQKSVTVDAVPADIVLIRSFVREQDTAYGPRRRDIVTLKHIAPSLVMTMVTSMFPDVKVNSMAAADAVNGDVALFGSAKDVEEAANLLKRLDRPATGPGGAWIFKMYEVRYASPIVLQKFLKEAMPSIHVTVGPESYSPPEPLFRTLGLGSSTTSQTGSQQGGQNGGQSGQGGQGSGQTTGGLIQPYQQAKEGDRAKTILLEGPVDTIDRAIQLLAQHDTKPKQVRVEVKVVDTSPEIVSNFGVDYSWSPFNFKEIAPGGSVTPSTTTRPAGLGQFSRVRWDFAAVLQALVTKKEAKILATPNIQVVDNDDAFIFIGDTLRVKVTQANGLGGQTINIEEFPIGIILLLRPRVNADGNITMRVHPIVSSITSQGSDGLPQSTSREAETTIMMKHGETVVIGGLIKDDMRRTVREVPILANIPILGELFRSRTTERKRSDIVLFITTHIVEDSDGGKSTDVKPDSSQPDKKGGG